MENEFNPEFRAKGVNQEDITGSIVLRNNATLNVILKMLVEIKAERTGKDKAVLMEEALMDVRYEFAKLIDRISDETGAANK